MVRRHRTGFVTIRFGPGWGFTVLGGASVLRVAGHEMYQDRTAPLPQPGESLAVKKKTWHKVTFHPSRAVRGRNGDRWVARFPLTSPWPDSIVLHPQRLCHVHEDGSVTWLFHEDWRFVLRTASSGTVDLSAEEFVAAVSRWAGTAPVPGTYTLVPEPLAPAAQVTVPDELLEDAPAADEP
jgi:hypothetical protein